MLDLRPFIRDIPDFPKPGILYKDITPLLSNPEALAEAAAQMALPFRHQTIDLVCGAESRGFIFGALLARELEAGFVPLRKPGKLPAKTVSAGYALEYGTDQLEIHTDAFPPGARVLLADDLLATGGTLDAGVRLIRELGGELAGISVLVELLALGGRCRLPDDVTISAVVRY